MGACTLWDFGIRQNFATLGDRNFETSGTVPYKSGVENLYFNGSHYNTGQLLPFDVGGVSYSPQAVSVLNMYWNQNFLLPMQTPTASAVLQVATITLTQAQVLVLNDTPQTVVPAQGAGTVIFLTGAVVQVKGSATYLTDDDELLLVLNDGTILSFSAFGGSTGDDVYLLANFAVGQNGYQVNAALYENQPIVATTTDENPTGTGGDVTITAYYVVLTLP